MHRSFRVMGHLASRLKSNFKYCVNPNYRSNYKSMNNKLENHYLKRPLQKSLKIIKFSWNTKSIIRSWLLRARPLSCHHLHKTLLRKALSVPHPRALNSNLSFFKAQILWLSSVPHPCQEVVPTCSVSYNKHNFNKIRTGPVFNNYCYKLQKCKINWHHSLLPNWISRMQRLYHHHSLSRTTVCSSSFCSRRLDSHNKCQPPLHKQHYYRLRLPTNKSNFKQI